MAIKIINQRSIADINTEKEKLEAKDQVVNNLGIELVKEKAKSMQKDRALQELGTEVAGLKIEIMKMKGGAK